jgi:curved DNA-binding protein CbpA
MSSTDLGNVEPRPLAADTFTLDVELSKAPEGNVLATDYYEILKVGPKADEDTIERVYRTLADRFHPDNPSTGDEATFLRLTEAYQTLSDHTKRAEYNALRESRNGPARFWLRGREFFDGVRGGQNRRLAVLCILYRQKTSTHDSPGFSILDLEQLTGCTREELAAALWYLCEKQWAAMGEFMTYTITADGFDVVESKLENRQEFRALATFRYYDVQAALPGPAQSGSSPNSDELPLDIEPALTSSEDVFVADHYEILGIGPRADEDTIERVYRTLAGRFHPDNPSTGDAKAFQRVIEAYEILSDHDRREEYNALRERTRYSERFRLREREFFDGIKGEQLRRLAVLCLLYRQAASELPGLTVLDLEQLTGCTREELASVLWYLREKKWAKSGTFTEYSITAVGFDVVENKLDERDAARSRAWVAREHVNGNGTVYAQLAASEQTVEYIQENVPDGAIRTQEPPAVTLDAAGVEVLSEIAKPDTRPEDGAKAQERDAAIARVLFVLEEIRGRGFEDPHSETPLSDEQDWEKAPETREALTVAPTVAPETNARIEADEPSEEPSVFAVGCARNEENENAGVAAESRNSSTVDESTQSDEHQAVTRDLTQTEERFIDLMRSARFEDQSEPEEWDLPNSWYPVNLYHANGNGFGHSNGNGLAHSNGNGFGHSNGNGLAHSNGDGFGRPNGNGFVHSNGNGSTHSHHATAAQRIGNNEENVSVPLPALIATNAHSLAKNELTNLQVSQPSNENTHIVRGFGQIEARPDPAGSVLPAGAVLKDRPGTEEWEAPNFWDWLYPDDTDSTGFAFLHETTEVPRHHESVLETDRARIADTLPAGKNNVVLEDNPTIAEANQSDVNAGEPDERMAVAQLPAQTGESSVAAGEVASTEDASACGNAGEGELEEVGPRAPGFGDLQLLRDLQLLKETQNPWFVDLIRASVVQPGEKQIQTIQPLVPQEEMSPENQKSDSLTQTELADIEAPEENLPVDESVELVQEAAARDNASRPAEHIMRFEGIAEAPELETAERAEIEAVEEPEENLPVDENVEPVQEAVARDDASRPAEPIMRFEGIAEAPELETAELANIEAVEGPEENPPVHENVEPVQEAAARENTSRPAEQVMRFKTIAEAPELETAGLAEIEAVEGPEENLPVDDVEPVQEAAAREDACRPAEQIMRFEGIAEAPELETAESWIRLAPHATPGNAIGAAPQATVQPREQNPENPSSASQSWLKLPSFVQRLLGIDELPDTTTSSVLGLRDLVAPEPKPADSREGSSSGHSQEESIITHVNATEPARQSLENVPVVIQFSSGSSMSNTAKVAEEQSDEPAVTVGKRVILSMGGKGGVGKTSVMSGLAEWFEENQVPVNLLDLDIENKAKGSLTHFFGGRVPKININTPAGLDAFIDHLDDDVPVILADMGAGAGKVTHEWFETMYPEIADWGVAFTAIGVVTSDPASVESVVNWAEALQNQVSYVIVKNHLTEHTDFTYWEENDQAQEFRRCCQPAIVHLDYRLADLENATRNYGVTLGQVASRMTSVPELRKASLVMRAQSYRRRMFAEFDTVKDLLLP